MASGREAGERCRCLPLRATRENFTLLFRSVRFPELIRNTLLAALITDVAVVLSSVVVAYGFARFPLPGGNLLFYVLIATMLIPEKVTLIPTYFFFVRVLHWNGSWLPILLPFFFGSAVYIFLLRQNFRAFPRRWKRLPCWTAPVRCAHCSPW